MEYTTNLNLKKPTINEYYNVTEQENANMDIIDEAVGKLNNDVGTEELTTEAQDCKGAINELNKKTDIKNGDYIFAHQNDGNFVIYDTNYNIIFSSKSTLQKINGYTTDNASPIYFAGIAVTWCIFNGFAIVDVAFGVGGTFDSSDGGVNINNVPIAPKPTKNCYAPACSENGKNTNNCTVKLDTDGNLKAIGKFTESSTTYHASFMFIVA